jgi:hypothetical protein
MQYSFALVFPLQFMLILESSCRESSAIDRLFSNVQYSFYVLFEIK